MNILKHPVFIAGLVVASSIYSASILNLPLPNWITFYVNDALCMPLVLSICLIGVRLIKADQDRYLPLLPIVLLTLFYALVFERWLPKSNPRYTADWVDVALYCLGSLLFFIFQRKLY
ncbi:hypothetical protein FNB79_04775 [Formosa sediminum]|uniref:Magnesium citrate secondary transporter n=1 Tax=Formosa sediminum TaxID=2594004 RepID=A0A516GP86_9FLAO|nr:hypothetical protein FNB79_04775 [Formosa sediminum]